jgi:hypothetical protein
MKDEKFEYIKSYYKVKADMYREVIVGGKKGVITTDFGHYIGVNFYDNITYEPLPCHPTSEVEYLETFNYKPPIKKLTPSAKRYRHFLDLDLGCTYKEYLGIKDKPQYGINH